MGGNVPTNQLFCSCSVVCLRNFMNFDGWAYERFEWPPSPVGNLVYEQVVAAMASRTPSNSVSGEAKDGTDSEQDLSLLLECLHFQQNCVTSQCQALSTIATMCNNSASSRDLLRTSGGLAYVLDLLYQSSSSPQLQQTALYTLGCAAERNLVNQMKLCDRKLFSLLADLLTLENTPPPLTTTAAYLAGCLMCSNSQGQNIAREERVIHRLIALFKSHLPTHPSSPVNSNPTYRIEIWTSVSSALCTATNNPQNETNQSLCSKVFPAALSLLQGRVEMARPAVTLITSCIANNTTTQDRLRMVGGLQILVGSIRELLIHNTLGATDSRDLLMHIVKALSAAAVGHAANCELLCSLETVRLLLALLQNEPLDTSAQVTVVMCLGMLTEDSPTSQKVFKDSDGLNIMLKCLVHSKDEELSKAATFVMQCCLPPTGDSLPSPTVEEKHISASIAKLDRILQPQEVIDDDNSSGNIRGAPTASGTNVLNAEALKVLDGQKLPVNDRVSHWLDAYPAPKQSGVLASKEPEELGRRCPLQNLTQGDNLEVLTQVLSTYTCPEPVLLNTTIPLAFISNPTEFQLENLRTAYLAAKTSGEPDDNDNHQKSFHEMKGGDDHFAKRSTRILEGESQMPSMGTLKHQPKNLKGQQMNTPTEDVVECNNQAFHNATSQELQREKARREELERELEKEKCKRLKLEQEAAFAREVEHQESRRQKSDGGGSDISQSQTVNCKRGQAGSAKTDHARYPQDSGNVRASSLGAVDGGKYESQVVRHPADTSSITAAAVGGKSQKLSSHQDELKKAKTPANGKTNIRYAESSSVSRAPKLSKLKAKATAPQNHSDVSKHTEERDKENITVASQSHLRPIPPVSVSSMTYSRVLETCTNSNSNDTPLHTPCSLASYAPSMAGCDHKCLGCYPRLKCPLITSRNFLKMLRVDHFTCAYHKRLVNRLANQMDTIPSTLIRPKLVRQQTGMSSSGHHILHTSHRAAKAPTHTHSTTATPQHPGSCSQRSAYQKSPPPCALPSLLSDQHEEQYVYSGSTQVDNTHDSPSPTSPEANIPSQRSYRATTTSSQPIYQYFKPSSTQNRKIPNQVHPVQPKAKRPFSKTHSKTPAKGSIPLADMTNTSYSTSNPLHVFDYQTPKKTKASNCKSKAMLPPSNHTEPNGGRRKQVHKARVPFSRQEEESLVAGVKKVGKRWRHILTAYHFHPSRTTVDLKDKYRLVEAKGRV